MLQENEMQLIQNAISQDPAAWASLLSLFGGQMYSIALRFLKNEKETEDVLQDTWIIISQKLKDFRGDCKLSTWIYRVTTNKCLEKIRSSKKEKEKTESIDEWLPGYQEDGHYKKEFSDWSNRPDKITDQKALKSEIERTLDSLPDDYREVLILRDIEGFSGCETAEMLGINEATMKTKLHRGRMALREKLERKFGDKPWTAFMGFLL